LSSRAQGRHRAAVRPKTPLSTIASQLQAGAGTAGRRSAVIAASSGLVVSLGVTAADAAPIGDAVREKPKAAPAAPAAPTAADATDAAADQVSVPAGVATATVSPMVGALVAPPPPPPPPVVEPERTEQVSRDADRSEPAEESSEESSDEQTSAAATGELSATRSNVMAVAARYVGTPYRYGGTTPAGFDCSGFVQYVFAQVGVSLPRSSGAQAAAAVRISRDQALPGDLVYMPGHIGIYAGGNLMYDSPTTGKSVSKREIFSSDFGFYRVLDS
jgi:cell wall-associated NlpC family hydrolase